MTRIKVLVLALLLAGCGSLPAERGIRIDLPALPAAQPLAGKGLSLRLLYFESSGVLQERNLAYVETQTPTELRQAATIMWELPPGEAVAAYLAGTLRGAGASVLASGMPGQPAYNLIGTLQRFELVGSDATGDAIVALDLTMADAKGAPYFNASYCAAAKAADRSLVSVQTAFQKALGDIASHLVSDLVNRANGAPVAPASPARQPASVMLNAGWVRRLQPGARRLMIFGDSEIARLLARGGAQAGLRVSSHDIGFLRTRADSEAGSLILDCGDETKTLDEARRAASRLSGATIGVVVESWTAFTAALALDAELSTRGVRVRPLSLSERTARTALIDHPWWRSAPSREAV